MTLIAAARGQGRRDRLVLQERRKEDPRLQRVDDTHPCVSCIMTGWEGRVA